jgi:hypothetical protein
MKLENSFPQKSKSIPYFFPNNGIIIDRIPEDIFVELNNEIVKVQKNLESLEKNNANLVGHMQHQYRFNHMSGLLNNYVVDLAEQHKRTFTPKKNFFGGFTGLKKNVNKFEFKVEDLWINLQRRHEFNPIHIHHGLYSFVIWMQIPYDIQEERNTFKDMNSDFHVSGNFNFYYIDIFGVLQNYSIELDKSKEGCICLFPSQLSHSVNPFYTSDGFRISLSGNVHLRHM